MSEISEMHREMYYACAFDEDGDYKPKLELIKKSIREYSKLTLTDLIKKVKTKIGEEEITHPSVIGIIQYFEKSRCVTGKQRDLLIKALAYSD
jgi:hypothetical protein